MEYMPSYSKILVLTILILAASSSWANDPNNPKDPNEMGQPLPGELFPFRFEEHDIVLLVPEDYNSMNPTPVIFYYHGAGGRANVDYLRYLTQSKGFILVGMSYLFPSGQTISTGRYTNYLKAEVKRLAKLMRYLEDEFKLKIDEKKMYIGGISKGGWYSYDVFEFHPNPWAGAMVIAAGRSVSTTMTERGSKVKIFKDKSVYIGVGENDTNRQAAENARRFLFDAQAHVTFEIYEGMGHEVDFESTVARQWLKDQLKNAEPKESDK